MDSSPSSSPQPITLTATPIESPTVVARLTALLPVPSIPVPRSSNQANASEAYRCKAQARDGSRYPERWLPCPQQSLSLRQREIAVVEADYWASNLAKPLATRARTSAPSEPVSGAASGSGTAHA